MVVEDEDMREGSRYGGEDRQGPPPPPDMTTMRNIAKQAHTDQGLNQAQGPHSSIPNLRYNMVLIPVHNRRTALGRLPERRMDILPALE